MEKGSSTIWQTSIGKCEWLVAHFRANRTTVIVRLLQRRANHHCTLKALKVINNLYEIVQFGVKCAIHQYTLSYSRTKHGLEECCSDCTICWNGFQSSKILQIHRLDRTYSATNSPTMVSKMFDNSTHICQFIEKANRWKLQFVYSHFEYRHLELYFWTFWSSFDRKLDCLYRSILCSRRLLVWKAIIFGLPVNALIS